MRAGGAYPTASSVQTMDSPGLIRPGVEVRPLQPRLPYMSGAKRNVAPATRTTRRPATRTTETRKAGTRGPVIRPHPTAKAYTRCRAAVAHSAHNTETRVQLPPSTPNLPLRLVRTNDPAAAPGNEEGDEQQEQAEGCLDGAPARTPRREHTHPLEEGEVAGSSPAGSVRHARARSSTVERSVTARATRTGGRTV